MTVSVVGFGLMGRPMAERLDQDGHDVKVWNRSAITSNPQNLPVCERLDEATSTDVVLLMLANSAAVDETMSKITDLLRPGQIVLDMGSSDPARSVQHAAELKRNGVGWVDAPVSGGPEGAAAGELSIMVGGDAADIEAVRPLLDTLGGNVVVLGGPGAGHSAKVVNQIIVCLTIEAVAEALALGEAQGLNLPLVLEALRGGFADSRILQVQGRRMIDREYVPGGRLATLHKDLVLAKQLSEHHGLSLPNVCSTIELSDILVDAGDANLDASALHKLRVAQLPATTPVVSGG